MNEHENLLIEEHETKMEMSKLLVSIRESNGISNPFQVSKELGQSVATLRNIEKGISFPTKKTLTELMGLYLITPAERGKLTMLKRQMLEIRKKLKESRK